jgi:hypothetical protein
MIRFFALFAIPRGARTGAARCVRSARSPTRSRRFRLGHAAAARCARAAPARCSRHRRATAPAPMRRRARTNSRSRSRSRSALGRVEERHGRVDRPGVGLVELGVVGLLHLLHDAVAARLRRSTAGLRRARARRSPETRASCRATDRSDLEQRREIDALRLRRTGATAHPRIAARTATQRPHRCAAGPARFGGTDRSWCSPRWGVNLAGSRDGPADRIGPRRRSWSSS